MTLESNTDAVFTALHGMQTRYSQCFNYPASQHLGGGIMKVGGHMVSAKREPIIMGIWGRAPSGVQGQSTLKLKHCSLRASHRNGKIAQFSIFCKLNTHMHDRPTMLIKYVFRKTITAMFEVASM